MTTPTFWSRARRARLPRVLLVYLAASWVVVQVANELRETLSLPAWISPVVLLLLLVGLVIISATAFVQADPSAPARAKREEIPEAWEIDLGDVRELVAEGRLPHLTWARAILGGVVAFSLLFGLAGGYVLLRNEGPEEAHARGRTMVAVLPFENLGSPEDGYFADGMTEEITARLAGLQQLGVISRTSTLQYKGTTKPIKQIGKELGVDYVLEGSVRWQPGAEGKKLVRITPQLIKVSDDSHVWADVYEEDSAEIFRIQSDIAGQVARALDVTLQGPERRSLEAKPTENLEAYDYYLQRRQGRFDEALVTLKRAAELDPRSGPRALELGSTLLMMRRYAEAEPYLDRAIALVPEIADAYQNKFLLYLDWGADTVRARATLLDAMGKAGEARVLSDAARNFGPLLLERIMGRDVRDKLMALDVSAFSPDTAVYYWTRARILRAAGQEARALAYADSARARLERVLELRPDAGEVHASLGFALALLGRSEEAVREARRGVELLPYSKDAISLTAWRLAGVLALVGQDDAAVDELERLLARPGYISADYLRIDPGMDPLRDNPRFQKLVAEGKS